MSTTTLTVGKTADNTYVTLDIAVERIERPEGFLTTEHERVYSYLELTISGTEHEVAGSTDDNGYVAGGQILDSLHRVIPNSTWTAESLSTLAYVWEHYHLNSMRAACAHQVRNDADFALTEPCPLTGYRCGSQWLVQELSESVLRTVSHLREIGSCSDSELRDPSPNHKDISSLLLRAEQVRSINGNTGTYAIPVDSDLWACVLQTAAELLQGHDDTGFSLDNWGDVRTMVETLVDHPIVENGV